MVNSCCRGVCGELGPFQAFRLQRLVFPVFIEGLLGGQKSVM